MKLTDVFERLRGKTVTRIDFKDGTHLQCPAPTLVDFVDADNDSEVCIESSADGLVLHFSASPTSMKDLRANEEPLSNIVGIV